MARLIAHSTSKHYLKRSSHLVKTPIKITLQPDERAFYSVAGSYSNQWPAAGFIGQNTQTGVKNVGSSCVGSYLIPTQSNQIWRKVTTSHDPEMVWYQGAYATSAGTLAAALTSGEAYIQLCGYHFSVPAGLADLDVTGIKVSFTSGGGVQIYQSAAGHSTNNSALKGKYDFSTWNVPFTVTPNLVKPSDLMQLPYDTGPDILADAGGFVGTRDLWGFGSSNRDGGIATLTTPVTKSFNMGSSTVAAFNANKGGWIVPYVYASNSQGINIFGYYPYYIPNNPGWWGCVSLWGLSIEISLG